MFWVWFCLPETKGATLEEMDRIFKSRTGAEDAAMLAEARRDVGLSDALDQIALEAAKKQQALDEKDVHIEVA